MQRRNGRERLVEFRELIDALIKRKQILFPDDMRYVTEFGVTQSEDDDHVFVASVIARQGSV